MEMFAPDLQRAAHKAAASARMSEAERTHMTTVGVEVLRRALTNCVDVPDQQQAHACFVEAADVPDAFVIAKSKHPGWSPS